MKNKNDRQHGLEPNISTPLLMTVNQMSQICGIGSNKLREMLENNELEHVQIGNRKLLAVEAIWNWYQKAKISAK